MHFIIISRGFWTKSFYSVFSRIVGARFWDFFRSVCVFSVETFAYISHTQRELEKDSNSRQWRKKNKKWFSREREKKWKRKKERERDLGEKSRREKLKMTQMRAAWMWRRWRHKFDEISRYILRCINKCYRPRARTRLCAHESRKKKTKCVFAEHILPSVECRVSMVHAKFSKKKHVVHTTTLTIHQKKEERANAIPFKYHLSPRLFEPHRARVIATSFHCYRATTKNASLSSHQLPRSTFFFSDVCETINSSDARWILG